MKPLRLLPLLAALTMLHAADRIPPPQAAPVRAINRDKSGPPIPDTPPVEKTHPPAILLWPNGAPGSEARQAEPEAISWRQEPDLVFPVISNIHAPSLTPYLPAPAKATGAAVIIAPGGGHMQLTIDREGYDLAQWLADRGIAAFVLKYRLARDGSTAEGAPQSYKVDVHALADARRAIRLVRARAAEWHVRPDRVGILGFSAGGELAILAALRIDAGDPAAADPLERINARPDFFAPIYPGGLANRENEIAKDKTPPAFLLCAYDDQMPAALASFFGALKRAGVNAELHIYDRGGHGFGVRTDRPDYAISGWPDRFVGWLGDRGFLQP
ncbi:MAG TPA: alpha/beta hydrolase [Opitutaceae bacterium]|nr:alpha/beta hydrolase [Opitutaceae bacterium]